MSYLSAFQNGKFQKKKVQVVYSTFYKSSTDAYKPLDRKNIKIPLSKKDFQDMFKINLTKKDTTLTRTLNEKEQIIYNYGILGSYDSIDQQDVFLNMSMESYEIIVFHIYHFLIDVFEKWIKTNKCITCDEYASDYADYADIVLCHNCNAEKSSYINRYINVLEFINKLYSKIQ